MSDPDPNERELDTPTSRRKSIAIMCPECGELLEVTDPEAVIRALHLTKACTLRTLFGSD